MKQRQNNRGFTMVELIVSMALAIIIGLAAVKIIAPVYTVYTRTLMRSDAEMIAGNVLDSIRSGAKGSATLLATGSGVDTGRGEYKVTGGRLMFDDEAVFASRYYNGKTISMTTEQAAENVVRVTIQVSGSGDTLCTVVGVVSPMRAVLTDSVKTPQGMAERAEKVVEAGGVPGGTALPNKWYFDKIRSEYYPTGFPVYPVEQIISRERLTAVQNRLLNENPSLDQTTKNYLADLLNQAKTYYLAVYITAGTYEQLVYLTDSNAARFQTAEHGTSYMIYYEGAWYARTVPILPSKTSNYLLPDTNNLTAEQLRAWVLDTSLWTPVQNYS